MALSLNNSNLSLEEPKFYIMKNFAFTKHKPKTSLLQEPESCCKYFVHVLYISRQTYKRQKACHTFQPIRCS